MSASLLDILVSPSFRTLPLGAIFAIVGLAIATLSAILLPYGIREFFAPVGLLIAAVGGVMLLIIAPLPILIIAIAIFAAWAQRGYPLPSFITSLFPSAPIGPGCY